MSNQEKKNNLVVKLLPSAPMSFFLDLHAEGAKDVFLEDIDNSKRYQVTILNDEKGSVSVNCFLDGNEIFKKYSGFLKEYGFRNAEVYLAKID